MTLRVGLRPPHELFETGTQDLRRVVQRAEELGLDHLSVGDHVSFRGGFGYDGLVHATALAMLSTRLEVHTAVYLLALRHPVTVARQVASLAGLAPGRVVFGVGAGGDDPNEAESSGVDARTLGRRMDEALPVLAALLAGETVDSAGPIFPLRGTRIAPAPDPPVPLLVGGRSQAALRRAGRFGQGWIGVWVSPERYADSVARVAEVAEAAGRDAVGWRHGLHAWCGFGRGREAAVARLAPTMKRIYGLPFERFSRYAPCGTPADVAAALSAYAEAGCREVHVQPAAGDIDEAVEAVAKVKRLLAGAGRKEEVRTK